MSGAGAAWAEHAAEPRPMQPKLIPELIEKRRIGVVDGDRYRRAVHIQPSCGHSNLLASRCDAAHRRSHEFKADRIRDGCAQDVLDLCFCDGIERPADHLVDMLQMDVL